jgi:hypothetical protein
MPYKHQSQSYRFIKGVRWESYGSFPKEQAEQEQVELRKQGKQTRRQSIGNGMFRVFTKACS